MSDTQESEAELLSQDIKSTLVSRNITVFGRRTSVRLEPEMWMALREIAKREKCSIHDICSLIGVRKNENTSLTAAIRVFLMLYFRSASTETGHRDAGHGSFDDMKNRARIPSEYLCFFKSGKETQDMLNGEGIFGQSNSALGAH
ncbi:MAG: hypothetical protein DHS20C02_03430 [Micavibrio sp.]|nr:MAG: hypothetical protein DHS20C02_03430 [Micavibrio sp.]